MFTLAVKSRLRSAAVWCHETVRPRSRADAVRGVVRLAAVIAAAEGALHFVIAPLTGHFAGQFEDFTIYLAVAHAAAAHADIYAGFKASTQSVVFGGFDYPPVVAILLVPLGWLSAGGAATLWLLLGVAATFSGSLVVARTLLPAHWPRIELALLATFAYPPATYNLWHGQLNPVVFLLLALALRAWVRGEEKSCGGFLAGAALLKLAPVLLLLLLVRRGWWKGIGVASAVLAGGAGLGMLVFGTGTTLEYVRDVIPVLGRETGWLYNESWSALVSRAADHAVFNAQPEVPVIWAVSVSLAVVSLVAALAFVRPGKAAPQLRGAQFGAGVAAMLLAGSVTWLPHDVHLLIPLAAASALAARGVTRRRLVAAVVAVIIAFCVVAPPLLNIGVTPQIIALARSPAWWPLLQLYSLPTLAVAALLTALTVAVARPMPPARSESRPARQAMLPV